eukprot:SAG31_NODE_27181_length_430_cov_0.776435_1_plen_57_part_01
MAGVLDCSVLDFAFGSAISILLAPTHFVAASLLRMVKFSASSIMYTQECAEAGMRAP